MIHLNQAGTSWPKPPPVRAAAAGALDLDPATLAADFDRHHQAIAGWLGVPTAELLLTPGGTSALAVGLAALPLEPGARVLCSGMEHHALHRPLRELVRRGIELVVAPRASGAIDLGFVERELRSGLALIACTTAANTTGELLPIEELGGLAHDHGALVLFDAAQSVGWERRPLPSLGADLVAFAGHKGLHGTWGVGGLWASTEVPFADGRPGWCDAGSVDRSALAALAAAMRWLDEPGQADRLGRTGRLADRFAAAVGARTDATLYGSGPRLPTVAFNLRGRSPATIADHFADRGVLVSGGHQCAPLAHRTLGTEGVVRVSFGAQNGDQDADAAIDALASLPRAGTGS